MCGPEEQKNVVTTIGGIQDHSPRARSEQSALKPYE
jgi:hypothetical protein